MYFLGIDLGTSAVKIILVEENGNVIGSTSKEYPVYYPQPGWSEQNPEDWWNATKDGIRELIIKTGVKNDDIKGIGLSGQMHGLVLLDENNNVLLPAILWNDQRTQEECDYITQTLGKERLTKYTGNKALTGFTAPKILWVRKHRPDVYKKIHHILLPKDYIRFKLTNEYATDVSDASGTLLFDVENRKWSKDMLDALDIPYNWMPKCYESTEVTGYVTKDVADLTGLKEGTIVVGGGGDQASGAVGTGTVKSGIVSVALGTSGVVFASQDKYVVDEENRLHSFCHANGKWHVMGVMLSAAACLKWWIDNIINFNGSSITYEKLLEEAGKVTPASGGLIFLPYLMGERTPYSDPYARGSFIGLNMTHNRGHITRAILEGVAFGLRDSLEIIKELNIPVNEVRVSGGGAKSVLWRQVLADIFGVRVDMVNATEGPAFGAAIMAAVGYGIFKDVEEATSELIKVNDSVYPIEENKDKYNEVYKIYRNLYYTLKDTFKDVSGIE
ncbi:xylulokinase [Thermoanaerobacter mathranii subsp. mathranii str. A3]|uniref:Xylulose kinase n=1 Tax=Thermoanaerobacter mathranii subsp. mathranii (strain DSM 11426 / CCUG 53645 / CIP 108742 / A3) TaxID=583358 RepID=A0ABM5LMU9_THEM3|nr:xylulokinase [Thermoanaerobacter mathranii]ADH60018.1 xylulokinase [Thermoanaerobacter mathranii subsp. mathranii str. A3]